MEGTCQSTHSLAQLRELLPTLVVSLAAIPVGMQVNDETDSGKNVDVFVSVLSGPKY